MKEFTKEELSQYNGKDGAKAYVAYNGKVYDVTDSMFWDAGDHQGMHEAGQDLTESLEDEAPHDTDVMDECPIVGTLKE